MKLKIKELAVGSSDYAGFDFTRGDGMFFAPEAVHSALLADPNADPHAVDSDAISRTIETQDGEITELVAQIDHLVKKTECDNDAEPGVALQGLGGKTRLQKHFLA